MYKEAYNLKDCIVVLSNLHDFHSKNYRLRAPPPPITKVRPQKSVKLVIKRKDNIYKVGVKTKKKPKERTTCHLCGQKCTTPIELYAHLVKVHVESNKKPNDGENNTACAVTMHCPICTRAFNRQSAFNAHMQLHYTEEDETTNKFKFRCHICKERFMELAELRQHKEEKHNPTNLPTNRENNEVMNVIKSKKCYLCSTCDMRFEKLEEFASHNKDQHGLYTEMPDVSKHIESVQKIEPVHEKLNILERALTSTTAKLNILEKALTTKSAVESTSVVASPQQTLLLATTDQGNWYLLSPTSVGQNQQNPGIVAPATNATGSPAVIESIPVVEANNTAVVQSQKNPAVVSNNTPPILVHKPVEVVAQTSIIKKILTKNLPTSSTEKDVVKIKQYAPAKSGEASTSKKSTPNIPQQKIITCTVCPEKFTNQELYKKHKNEHHIYYCSLCSCKFSSIAVLRKHVQTHKTEVPKTATETPDASTTFAPPVEVSTNSRVKCTYCPKIFINRKFLARHLQSAHQKTTCYVCCMEFPPEKLSKHFAMAHRNRKHDVPKSTPAAKSQPDVIVVDDNDGDGAQSHLPTIIDVDLQSTTTTSKQIKLPTIVRVESKAPRQLKPKRPIIINAGYQPNKEKTKIPTIVSVESQAGDRSAPPKILNAVYQPSKEQTKTPTIVSVESQAGDKSTPLKIINAMYKSSKEQTKIPTIVSVESQAGDKSTPPKIINAVYKPSKEQTKIPTIVSVESQAGEQSTPPKIINAVYKPLKEQPKIPTIVSVESQAGEQSTPPKIINAVYKPLKEQPKIPTIVSVESQAGDKSTPPKIINAVYKPSKEQTKIPTIVSVESQAGEQSTPPKIINTGYQPPTTSKDPPPVPTTTINDQPNKPTTIIALTQENLTALNEQPQASASSSSAQEKPKIFLKSLKDLMGSPEKQPQRLPEKKKAVSCVDCGGTFKTADLLLEHVRQSRFKKCTQCDYHTCGVLPLNRHYDSQHRIWVYQCNCGLSFNKRREFEIHLVQTHENSKELDSEGKIKISFFTTPVQCGLCHNIFSNFRLLKFHLQTQHPDYIIREETSGLN